MLTAGLEIVANHGHLFAFHLCKHYKQWYEDLLAWSKSNNPGDSRVGLRALLKFFDAITIIIGNEDVNMEEEENSFIDADFHKEFCEVYDLCNVYKP